MTLRGRLLFVSMAMMALALLGVMRTADHAFAANATSPSGAPSLYGATAPCVTDGPRGEASSSQQTTHHAGLVVVFPDRTEARCIEFAGDDITGTELLRQSGLSVVFAGFGGLGSGVCRIEDTGCSDPRDCFCQCRGAECQYWAYFALRDGSWAYQSLGPSQRRLHDGDVDAWVWGSNRSSPPEADGPCPTPEPTAVPTPAVVPSESTLLPPADGSTGGQGARTPGAPAVARDTPAPDATTATLAPTRTPAPQVAARQDGPRRDAANTNESPSGGGAPVGLIAFGAVCGVLAAGIGGLLLRRQLRG